MAVFSCVEVQLILHFSTFDPEPLRSLSKYHSGTHYTWQKAFKDDIQSSWMSTITKSLWSLQFASSLLTEYRPHTGTEYCTEVVGFVMSQNDPVPAVYDNIPSDNLRFLLFMSRRVVSPPDAEDLGSGALIDTTIVTD